MSSTMPENMEKLSGWHGLLVRAILEEPGKPNRGPEIGPKLIKNVFFCSFFYSVPNVKFCHDPE